MGLLGDPFSKTSGQPEQLVRFREINIQNIIFVVWAVFINEMNLGF